MNNVHNVKYKMIRMLCICLRETRYPGCGKTPSTSSLPDITLMSVMLGIPLKSLNANKASNQIVNVRTFFYFFLASTYVSGKAQNQISLV